MFQDKIVVITGGVQGIGKCIADEFLKEGAMVCVIDKQPGGYFTGDLADERTLSAFADKVISEYGHVDYLINNALPLMKGIDTCSYDEFNYALRVGVTAPFYLAKLFAPYFSQGAAIINISSTRDRMSQPQTESYAAAKGGISALTHALAVSFSGKVRVNSIIILYFLMVDITFSFLWTSWACQLSGSCPALSPASLSAWGWACPDPVSTALCPAWWLRWSCPPN